MCLGCEGKGKRIIEMQYLEDIVLECEDCKGKKLKPLYSQISDGKMTISEAMSAPLHQVLEGIDLTPKFRRVFEYIKLLHLDYLSLERPINSLSGGEKQRIYLLSKLLKSPQNTLIIMENPSFGLSTLELNSLAEFLLKIRKMGNTVVIIDASEEFQEVAEAEMVFEKDKIITQVFT
jgi:excinuclease ABC subunit A